MATVAQIIEFANRKFPNSETDSNKTADLNDIHNNVYLKIKRLKNDFDITESTTVANQATYTLPTGCKIENLVRVTVSKSETNVEFDTYDYAALNDDVKVGRYYVPVTDTVIALFDGGEPLKTSGLTIMFYYFAEPVQLSSTTQTPNLDPMYHNALKYALVAEIASQGRHPHTEIANYWQSRYDDFVREIEKDLTEKFNTAPVLSNRAVEHW